MNNASRIAFKTVINALFLLTTILISKTVLAHSFYDDSNTLPDPNANTSLSSLSTYWNENISHFLINCYIKQNIKHYLSTDISKKYFILCTSGWLFNIGVLIFLLVKFKTKRLMKIGSI